MNTTSLTYTPAAVAGIRARVGFEITPAERETVEPLIAEFERLRKLESEYSRGSAVAKHTANLSLAETDPASVPVSGLSRDQVIDDFRERSRAVRRAFKTLEPQSAAACEPILRRFRDAALELAADHEEREKGLCEDLGIPFGPSPSLNSIRARADLTEKIIVSSRAHGGADPSRVLAGLL